MVMPLCTDGINDMFEPGPWNLTYFTDICQKKWGPVTPEPFKAWTMFGGSSLQAASNIIFSNGKLDPCSGGGVLKSISKSVVAILMDQAAHHLDLRSANPADPESVIKARKLEKAYVRTWLNEAREQQTR